MIRLPFQNGEKGTRMQHAGAPPFLHELHRIQGKTYIYLRHLCMLIRAPAPTPSLAGGPAAAGHNSLFPPCWHSFCSIASASEQRNRQGARMARTVNESQESDRRKK
jgi:hypothetical protein